MSITASDKIFIGVDDEINFVVEKILTSEKDRIILVVPQNALIVSSLVSMRILAKQITKSKKQIVLVTEDEFGTKLAKTAGLVPTNKVSNISPETWESAQIAKEKAKAEADKIKKELLANRGIGVATDEVEVSEPDEQLSENSDNMDSADLRPENKEISEDEAEVTEGNSREGSQEQLENADAEDDLDKLAKNEEKDVKIKGPIQRTRRQPKMVDVGGFQVYAGGDINEVITQDMQNNESPLPSQDRLERPRVSVNKDKTNGFTSRDWSSYTNDPSPRFNLAKLFKRDETSSRNLNPDERKKKQKLIIAGIAIFLFVVLGATYVLAFRLSTVDIRITLKTAEVPVEQQMAIDTAVSQIDEEKLIVPARVLTEENLSISASDTATGEGAGGSVAAGVIDVWNKTTNQITIPAGTVIENTTSNLKYVIKEDVTVRAKNANDTLDIGRTEDVSVEAEKFGDEYNITESGTKTDFKVGTYTTADVVGKRFRPIEGGTTRKFKSPSQADFDKVKKTLSENIAKQGLSKIKNLVPEGYRLIEETAKFEEVTARSTPEVGKEGDSFSLTLEGKMTALMVADADLDKAISLLIARNQQGSEEDDAEFEVQNLGDAEISEVVREGDKATFKVVSRGSLTSKVTEESIKQGIAGKTISEAEEYLIKVSEIDTSRIIFNPGFLPNFLHRVPTDWSRIKINFQ